MNLVTEFYQQEISLRHNLRALWIYTSNLPMQEGSTLKKTPRWVYPVMTIFFLLGDWVKYALLAILIGGIIALVQLPGSTVIQSDVALTGFTKFKMLWLVNSISGFTMYYFLMIATNVIGELISLGAWGYKKLSKIIGFLMLGLILLGGCQSQADKYAAQGYTHVLTFTTNDKEHVVFAKACPVPNAQGCYTIDGIEEGGCICGKTEPYQGQVCGGLKIQPLHQTTKYRNH